MKKNKRELRELWFIAAEDNASVDKATRTLVNAVVLKPKSLNGYVYSQKALEQFVAKAGKPKSYFDHNPWNDVNRSVRELAGYIDNVRLEGEAVRGDAHIGPVEYGDMVLWLGENQPNVVGFSSVSEAMMNDEGTEVMEILQVISVDIVTNPATVKGLFESAQQKEPETMDEKEKQRLERDATALEEKVKALTSQVATLTNERDTAVAANKKLTRESVITNALAEAKLPEKAVTPLFRTQLLEATDEKAVKALIEDRKTVVGDAVISAASSMMSEEKSKSSSDNNVKAEDIDDVANAFGK